MRQFGLGLLTGVMIAVATQSLSAGFVFRNQRVSQITGNRALTSEEIGQALMAESDRYERLQTELSALRLENQKIRKELAEMELTMTQFKNLYFRQF
jgi:hypothetical protein